MLDTAAEVTREKGRTHLDGRVPPLHRHAALDELHCLPDRRRDLGRRRRQQLHLPVFDESCPPRRQVRCKDSIKIQSQCLKGDFTVLHS